MPCCLPQDYGPAHFKPNRRKREERIARSGADTADPGAKGTVLSDILAATAVARVAATGNGPTCSPCPPRSDGLPTTRL